MEASWRRGDPHSSNRKHRSGGLRILVSNQDGSHMASQIEEALAFLKANRSGVAMLVGVRGVESALLDFSWDVPIRGDIQWNRWPPELCKLCGELGIAIEVTAYVV